MLGSVPTRDRRGALCTTLHLLAKFLLTYLMYSNHNGNVNFSHSPFMNKLSLSNVDREIKMGEFRLRYVQLMRDVNLFLGDEDTNLLIKESEAIWDKLTNSAITE